MYLALSLSHTLPVHHINFPFEEFLVFQFQLNQKKFHPNANLRSVATGSWGCGSQLGDSQFKVIIQWLAASVANVPVLIYYTCSNENLSKLDTVVRVLHGKFPRQLSRHNNLLHNLTFFSQIGSGRWVNYSDTQSFMPKIFSITPQPPTRISASLTNSSDWKKRGPLLMSGRDSSLFIIFKCILILLSIRFFFYLYAGI